MSAGKATAGAHPGQASRRALLAAGGSCMLLLTFLAPGARAAEERTVNVTGWGLPRLAFTMTDANTGREVSARDFHGQVVLLYFGYTNCPDVCPMTLHNIALVLGRLGPNAGRVRALFVTVDPDRDTLPVLHKYTRLFAPGIVGMRGTANQLASLASRYHIGYSVSAPTAAHPYEVDHSSVIYVFDARGRARLLIPSLDTSTANITGVASALSLLLGRENAQAASDGGRT